ncbi:hydantoinase/carbamoylase family amidase [Metarhizium robertsii ARSEF 23]|uniref:Hydantoinase/carbamoylase family amidase n=1 Tax=Metarhizium robertsii (strain ARSEF 23 / ATCC MYA-3075) TaxID=655844 RepID=E9F8B1_METRA|nr:hydantoinase/carbamoylase family amidase [Metarhizium robertsii ARSEF 23]EFY96018.1 hydantoinase/carbamoylase family amidase [Metarhizium robertsii ARSEF 23]
MTMNTSWRLGHASRSALLTRPMRFFSTSRLQSLKINADRLNETLHYTCQWGAANRYGDGPNDTGMSRLALSDDDARVRQWFAQETAKLDCQLTVDKMGNQFAKRAGSSKTGAPMIAMGSHLDTQPRGGRYDGILGVLAAVEVLRTLKDADYTTNYDVGAINWTNEEGARFPNSMVSSGVWAGKIPIEKAWSLADIFDPSATMHSELVRHGYVGSVECSSDAATGYPLTAHFELHIEQGPILERTGKRIGVVQGAQAYKWLTVSVTGRDAHTGTTPLDMRSDPLLATAKMIASSNAIAKKHGALASTGVVKIPPNSSTNTIASTATFSLDIRHPEDHVVAQVLKECLASFDSISKEDGKGVKFKWSLDTDSEATKFDRDCIKAVEMAANDIVGPDGWSPLTSGAGHDSVYTSKKVPTTMIFVPCKDGVSHHPEEYCSPEDCAIGAQALLQAVINYDKMLVSGNH